MKGASRWLEPHALPATSIVARIAPPILFIDCIFISPFLSLDVHRGERRRDDLRLALDGRDDLRQREQGLAADEELAAGEELVEALLRLRLGGQRGAGRVELAHRDAQTLLGDGDRAVVAAD